MGFPNKPPSLHSIWGHSSNSTPRGRTRFGSSLCFYLLSKGLKDLLGALFLKTSFPGIEAFIRLRLSCGVSFFVILGMVVFYCYAPKGKALFFIGLTRFPPTSTKDITTLAP